MEISDQLREAQESLTKIRRLEEHIEWLQTVANIQLEQRLSAAILTPPTGVDDMVAKAYAMGECAGIKLIMSLPGIYKETISDDIKQMMQGAENADGK